MISIENSKTIVRYDRLFTTFLTDKAKIAFEYLSSYIEHNAYKFSLKAGEMAILDNNAVVHARSDFAPKFDGSDRWLKRTVSLAKRVSKSVLDNSMPNVILL